MVLLVCEECAGRSIVQVYERWCEWKIDKQLEDAMDESRTSCHWHVLLQESFEHCEEYIDEI